MIDALRHGAVVMLEAHHQTRLGRHGGAEFERYPERITHVQGLALIRPLHPLRGQAGFLEIVLRLLQILLGETAHADALRFGRARAPEHERMMARLGDATQIQRILVLVADDEANQVDIERAALAEILHVQHRVAGAGDIEGRIIVGLWDRHGMLQVCGHEPIILVIARAAWTPLPAGPAGEEVGVRGSDLTRETPASESPHPPSLRSVYLSCAAERGE